MYLAEKSYNIRIGDVVRVGNGKVKWKVRTFWTSSAGVLYADLGPLTGYSQTSATLDRLTREPS